MITVLTSPDPDDDEGVGLGACTIGGCDLVDTNMSLGSEGTKEGNIVATVAAAAAAEVTGLVNESGAIEKGVGVDALVVVSSSSSSSSS